MIDFIYKMVEDGTYCIMQYTGDEADIVIPAMYCGKPVTILYDGLFSGHTEITSVHIPETVEQMGGFLFDGCCNLHQIELPSGLTDMWGYAFVRSAIQEIVLPEHVHSIVPYTFKDCKNLKRVICNPELKKIYAHAFEGCDQLKEIQYGTKTVVDEQAFS